MGCKDHQGNIINIGDKIAFSRDHYCYIGKVVSFTQNNNPRVEYTFIDFRDKQKTYTYSIIRDTRYIKILGD